MPEAHLPLWALYAQALGGIVVAFVAAVIASIIQYRQWQLGHDRLRLDLSERRAKVFDALFSEVMVTDGDEKRLKANVARVLRDIEGYRFLFPASLVEEIEDARLTLMFISNECEKETINHREIITLLNKYLAKAGTIGNHMLPLLRFN